MRRLILLLGLLVCPAWASVSFTNLTHGGSVAATTTYATASVTPTANNIVLVTLSSRLAAGNGPLALTAVSGDGLTWVNWASVDYGVAQGTGFKNRLEIWCGVGASPSTGALTLTYSTNPTGVAWGVDQSSGAATTCAAAKGIVATNGVAVATATPLTVTMGTFNSSSNATYGGGSVDAGSIAVGQGAGFTELGPTTTQDPSGESEFAAGNVSPVTMTYSGANVVWGIIGVEVQIPASATASRPSVFVIAP